MDKYNQKWVKTLFKADPWAVTIGQTTYYSCPKWYVDKRQYWMRHEDKHKEQWKRDGWLRFAIKYLYYHLRYGHDKNPYEIEASQ